MREPIVAGKFYSGNADELKKGIVSNFIEDAEKFEVKGVVSPHAGYVYSGAVAGATLSHIIPADTYIIIGPNHTGYGAEVSISNEDSWRTPLGEVEVDDELRKKLLESSDKFEEDEDAHKFEHSIEVQLPFLQMLRKDFSFVPITIRSVDKNIYQELAESISKVISQLDKSVVIVASSDMTHYEPETVAKDKDYKVIQKILSLNAESIFNTVKSERVSMCGYMPVTIMVASCKKMGAKETKLIKYQTSGDITGDKSSVVGYAGIVVY